MNDCDLTVDDGVRIHYLDAGSGEPALIFVHGWCSNADHFENQYAHFASDHRVLGIDRRGHGRSDVPDSGYSAERHAHDLAAILDHEGIATAVIIGHAGGCPSVLRFAADHPDRCRGLVLLDTRISASADLRGADSASPLAQMVEAIADDDTFRTIYRGFVAPGRADLAESLVLDAQRVPRPVAQQDLASIAVDTVALARQVQCPVLWLTAEPADSAMLGEVFTSIVFHQVTDSGHFVQLEVPHQVNAAIEDFLEGTK